MHDHYLGEDLHHLDFTDERVMALAVVVIALVICMKLVSDDLKQKRP
jgi:hypothetical protein